MCEGVCRGEGCVEVSILINVTTTRPQTCNCASARSNCSFSKATCPIAASPTVPTLSVSLCASRFLACPLSSSELLLISSASFCAQRAQARVSSALTSRSSCRTSCSREVTYGTRENVKRCTQWATISNSRYVLPNFAHCCKHLRPASSLLAVPRLRKEDHSFDIRRR